MRKDTKPVEPSNQGMTLMTFLRNKPVAMLHICGKNKNHDMVIDFSSEQLLYTDKVRKTCS